MTFPAAPFLDAIRAAPDDDAPRLIYADWLDEQGESTHAAFIRLQIATANALPYSLEREVCREREFQFMPSRRIPRDVDNPPTLSVSFQRGLPAIVELEGDAFDGRSAPARWQALCDTGPGLRGVSFRNPESLLQADWLQRPPPFRVVEFSLSGDLETFTPANVERVASSPWLHDVEHLKIDVHLSGWRSTSTLASIRPILEALSQRTHGRLRSLELAGNWHFREPGGRETLSDLNIFDQVDTLNVFRDSTDVGLESLFESNRFTSLRTLVMHNLAWPLETRDIVPESVFRALTTLDLGTLIATDLADFLPACSERASSLQCLIVAAGRRNRTSPPLPTDLRWPSLKRLRLDHNRLLAGDVKALANWPLGAHLDELSLEECEIGSVGVRALAASPTLVNLRALNLRGNQFSVQAEMKLRKSRRFPRLKTLLV